MPNIRVKAACERALKDLEAAVKQMMLYSGISEKEAPEVDRIVDSILETAARIGAEARAIQGNTSGKTLVSRVLRASGRNP